jgi:hypothetical protein
VYDRHTYKHCLLRLVLWTQAKATRDLMDGTMVDGRARVVRLRSERSQPSERPHRPPPGEVDDCKLYVAGLTRTVQEHALRELFGK